MKCIALCFLAGAALFCAAATLNAQTVDSSSNNLQVVDAKLCHAIKNRVIEDQDSTFVRNSKVFLWLQTAGGAHSQISVTWKNGLYTHITTLMIGGSPWRTWASKIVRTGGDWGVTITDEKQNIIQEKRFHVK